MHNIIPVFRQKELLFSDGFHIKIDNQNVKLNKYLLKSLISIKNKQELVLLINKEFNIDINTPEGLQKLNTILDYSINVFFKGSKREEILKRKGINIDDLFINGFEFKNIDEIFHFIRSIDDDYRDDNKINGLTKCYILKVSSIVKDILGNNFNKLPEIESKLFSQLSYMFNISSISGDLYKGRINGTNFLFYGRPKKVESIIIKGLTNPNYSSIENINDSIGYTIEIEDINDESIKKFLLLIINIFQSLGFSINGIKSKNILTKETNLAGYEINHDSRKISSGSQYEDIKIIGENDSVPGGIEVKIIKKGNVNNLGINSHFIYKLINVDIMGLKMNHFSLYNSLTKKEIEDEIDFFIENLNQGYLDKNKETQGLSLEEFLIILWKDLKYNGYITALKIDSHKKRFINQIKSGLYQYIISKLIENNKNEFSTKTNNLLKSISDE